MVYQNSIGNIFNSKKHFVKFMERDRILSGKVAKAYKRLSFNKKIIFWNYIKLNYSKEDAILKAYNKNLEKNELNQDGKIVKIKTWFK